MRSSTWKTEADKLLILIIAIIILGLTTDKWLLAIAIPCSVYIGFNLYRIFELHSWLKNGLKDELTPDGGGIWGSIAYLIYQHKKLIEQNTLQQKQLNKQLHDIISAIPSATVILNTSNEIIWSNQAALPLLGIDKHRDYGLRIDNIIRQDVFVDYLERKRQDSIDITSPISEKKTLAIQVIGLGVEKKVLIAYDLTPYLDIQRSRKAFIANASHELRTPLTVISGYLDFMQSDPKLPDFLIEPIDKALIQTQNMETIINDLLTLSKLENKKLSKSEIDTIDLKSHLSYIKQVIKTSDKDKNHTIIYSCPDGLTLEASSKEVDSVCYNLINNAIKYSEHGKPIKVEWKEKEDHIIFSVIDQGIGMEAKHINHITERFYRVDSSRSRRVGGTGLGLSIVKHILERHHGHLKINSKIGYGSTFSAIFPKKQDFDDKSDE